jgi:hypothetical protein
MIWIGDLVDHGDDDLKQFASSWSEDQPREIRSASASSIRSDCSNAPIAARLWREGVCEAHGGNGSGTVRPK